MKRDETTDENEKKSRRNREEIDSIRLDQQTAITEIVLINQCRKMVYLVKAICRSKLSTSSDCRT